MKRTFLESFANDPAQFIQTWLESQSRDLECILGSGPSEGQTVRQEELKRSEFFQLPWVEEVCKSYLYILSWVSDLMSVNRPWRSRRVSVCRTRESHDMYRSFSWLLCIPCIFSLLFIVFRYLFLFSSFLWRYLIESRYSASRSLLRAGNELMRVSYPASTKPLKSSGLNGLDHASVSRWASLYIH